MQASTPRSAAAASAHRRRPDASAAVNSGGSPKTSNLLAAPDGKQCARIYLANGQYISLMIKPADTAQKVGDRVRKRIQANPGNMLTADDVLDQMRIFEGLVEGRKFRELETGELVTTMMEKWSGDEAAFLIFMMLPEGSAAVDEQVTVQSADNRQSEVAALRAQLEQQKRDANQASGTALPESNPKNNKPAKGACGDCVIS